MFTSTQEQPLYEIYKFKRGFGHLSLYKTGGCSIFELFLKIGGLPKSVEKEGLHHTKKIIYEKEKPCPHWKKTSYYWPEKFDYFVHCSRFLNIWTMVGLILHLTPWDLYIIWQTTTPSSVDISHVVFFIVFVQLVTCVSFSNSSNPCVTFCWEIPHSIFCIYLHSNLEAHFMIVLDRPFKKKKGIERSSK